MEVEVVIRGRKGSYGGHQKWFLY